MKRVATAFIPPVAIDRRSATPLHRQLYGWFRASIVHGRLQPGTRVPSSRGLAADLGISRLPVVNAYEQLHAEGFFETLIGSGTRVAAGIPGGSRTARSAFPCTGEREGRAASDERAAALRIRQRSERGKRWESLPRQTYLKTLGAFRVSLPALDHFPVNLWSKLLARHSRAAARETLSYGAAEGHRALREAIADYLGTVRSVRCTPHQILITTGSQQALQIVAQVLLDPGASMCMEEPGYPGARHAFSMAGAEVISIPVDSEGLSVSALWNKGRKARLVYVTPSHQYPLGMTMSAARRMSLLKWAARRKGWIIEDDYDSEFRFDARPVASLQGLDTNARVIYVGTFSKVMFPALRLGYMVLPVDLMSACCAAKDILDIFSPTLPQLAVTDFIVEGHFARHIRRMRMLYKERRSALVTAIQSHLSKVLRVIGAEAGMHFAALLPDGVNDLAVSAKASLKNISAMPLSSHYHSKAGRVGGLVLGYGGIEAEHADAAVQVLKSCIT